MDITVVLYKSMYYTITLYKTHNTTIAMSQTTVNKSEQDKEQKLSDKAASNLSELDLTLVTTSNYFKPEDAKTYMIYINPEDKVEMVKNPKFASPDGYVPTRFEFHIKHIDNNAQQLWTVSKTACKQIVTELGRGFTVLQITRHGSDRSTIYDIKGV
jgi:hypothetical protein